MSFIGVPIDGVKPGSSAWLKTISASKIAAILGISPWESKYSLWHRMNGTLAQEAETTTTRRGHYLEPAIAAWFQDQHPDLDVEECGTYAHPSRSDWVATPDRLAIGYSGPGWDDHEVSFGVECKSVMDTYQWGAEGTAEIPPYYLAQVAWQMLVTGIRRVYVPIITGNLVFKEYVVDWDDISGDVAYITKAVGDFKQSLTLGIEPAFDSSDATYQAVRWMHPDIEDREVEIPAGLATEFLEVRALKGAAEQKEQLLKNRIAAHLGNARKATYLGVPLFTRQAKSGGKPYLVAAKNLPTIEQPRKAS